MMEQEGFKYYAFISYSHKDKQIAKRLQKRLERYHLPSAVKKTYPELPKNLRPVFIDESDLVATGTLKTALQANLDRSNYLIVVCSPSSAKSEYVNDEVEYFIKNGREDHIIPLIIDGVPHAENADEECFPRAILGLPRDRELLGISLKVFGERDAFLRVIATMLGLDLDSFVSREARERKRKAMIFTPIAAALMVIAGVLIWYSANFWDFFSEKDANAQLIIGYKYYLNKDYSKALEWYEKAAAQGLAEAQCNIGEMYRRGLGVEQDYFKALEWYEKAAAQGNASAQNIIGEMYSDDLRPKALEWYEKAAAQGYASAQYHIGEMYRQGLGVEQDYLKALEWYEKAATLGDAFAQFQLGIIYDEELGVEQDDSKALEWYEKAADQGNLLAQLFVGDMYYYGNGVEQDYVKALEYFEKAAAQGYASAQCNIGEMYRDGLGLPQDKAKAIEWFRKAADQGHNDAKKALAALLASADKAPISQ